MGNIFNIYIDESGSITDADLKNNPWFIVALLHVDNPNKLRDIYKRFISKKMSAFKSLPKADKMFDANGHFHELKGSALSPALKKDFVNHFCRNNLFSLTFIRVDNTRLSKKMQEDKARSFNYLLKLVLYHLFNSKRLQPGKYFLHIDERNVKTKAKAALCEYLNTEIPLEYGIESSFDVQYYDSAANQLIQMADVFSNICYSNKITAGMSYATELNTMKADGYINCFFDFPKTA